MTIEYEPPRYYIRWDGMKIPLQPDHITLPDGSKLPISDYRYGNSTPEQEAAFKAEYQAEPPLNCTCHPDDNPPKPCPRKHAYSECVAAARNLGGCNICGERLHMGCCNPNRPKGVPPGQPSDALRELFGRCKRDEGEVYIDPRLQAEPAPYALTDTHVRALEKAIRAEGYIIIIDPDGNITLERFEPRADDPLAVHNMLPAGEPLPNIDRTANTWWRNVGGKTDE